MNETTNATQGTGASIPAATLSPAQAGRNTYALIVGVDDYSTFSPSMNLLGSLTDVDLLVRYCRQQLGLPPENIRVLTSPKHSPPFHVHWTGSANLENVKTQVTWLLEKTKGAERKALLAFSGHGSWKKHAGPLLCFTDATTSLDAGVLPLRELRAAIAWAGAQQKLVAMLDCCYARGSAVGGALTVKALQGDEPDHDDPPEVSERVLHAAGAGKPAYQMPLGGLWHGVLTFALVTAAKRWRSSPGVSQGSYKQVLSRAKELTIALGVPQRPKFHVPPDGYQAIRKEPFLGIAPGYTVKKPNALGRSVQLDPNWVIYLYAGPSDFFPTLAEVLTYPSDGSSNVTVVQPPSSSSVLKAPGYVDAGGQSLAGAEAWYLNNAQVPNIASLTSLFIVQTLFSAQPTPNTIQIDPTMSTGTGLDPLWSSPEAASWPLTTPANVAGMSNFWFHGTDATSGNPLYLQLVLDGTALRWVKWWLADSAPSSGVQPGTRSGVKYTQVSLPLPVANYFEATSLATE